MNQSSHDEQYLMDEELSWDEQDSASNRSKPEHPLRRLHRLLRGRYLLLIVLLAVLGLGAAVAGYESQTELYESKAWIYIQTERENPINGRIHSMPNKVEFFYLQARLLSDERIIENALSNEYWLQLNQNVSQDDKITFRDNLGVRPEPGQNMINLRFLHEDPRTAQAALRAVIEEYEAIYDEKNPDNIQDQLRQLNSQRRQLNVDKTAIENQIDALTAQYGSNSLDSLHDLVREQIRNLQRRLTDARLELANAKRRLEQEQANDTQDEPAEDQNSDAQQQDPAEAESPEAQQPMSMASLPDEQLIAMDRRAQEIHRETQLIQRRIDELTMTYGEKHRLVQAAENQLSGALRMLNQRLGELRDMPMPTDDQMLTEDLRNGPITEQRVALVQMRAETLEEQLGELNKEFGDISTRMIKVQERRAEIQALNTQLQAIEARIQELNLQQSQDFNRITISQPNMPLRPSVDNKRKWALMGGFGGVAFAFCSVLALGILDRRLRAVDDAKAHLKDVSLLGVLPELDDELTNATQALSAARGIHHVRTLLQLGDRYRDNRGQAIAITSPMPASGKTSVTLAMGISFANANAKTLMIDLDLAGGGLTRRVDATVRRKIGSILLKSGLADESQLGEALQLAQQSNRKVGEALIELGYVDEDSLGRALSRQEDNLLGAMDALYGEMLDNCVASTGVEDLSILPLGRAASSDISRISPDAMKTLLNLARQHYDVVLVDTGPVPGSLEAAMAAAGCDHTILVVTRNMNRGLAINAVEQLRAVRADLVGFVFNRARPEDMVQADSIMSIPADEDAEPNLTPAFELARSSVSAYNRFDPVARAVAGFARFRPSDTELRATEAEVAEAPTTASIQGHDNGHEKTD